MRSRFLFMCGICLFTAFIYNGALSTYFLGDDLDFLEYLDNGFRQNKIVSQLASEFVSPPYRVGFFYRPITNFSYLVDYLIWGANPLGWHLMNLLIHCANVVLLWSLVEHLAKNSINGAKMAVGGIAATIFTLRPCSPEAVIWPAGRVDGLVLLSFLIALLAYLRADGRWGRYYFLALCSFLFAIGSKEAGVTLPGGLFALHIAGAISVKPVNKGPYWLAWVRQAFISIWPFMLLLLIYFIWRFLLFGTPFTVYQNDPPINFFDPVWRIHKLNALHFFISQSPKIAPLGTFLFIATLIQVLIGFFITLRSPTARRIWVFGIFWLMVTFLPMIQHLYISPTGENARLLYIPGAALSILLVAPLTTFFKSSSEKKSINPILVAVGAIGIMAVISLSIPLRNDLMRPWLKAGHSMKALPPSIAKQAEKVSKGSLAILAIPDHVEGAVFGRNGQGSLMAPPIQERSLQDRVLIVTPPTLTDHFPRLLMSPQILRLEYWCWNVEAGQFERLPLWEYDAEKWLEAWRVASSGSECRWLTEELETLGR